MTALLALDVGGTRTRAIVFTEAGHVLGRGDAGPGNDHDRPTRDVARALRSAIDAAFADAGLRRARVDVAAFAMASAASRVDLARLSPMVGALRVADDAFVVHDSEATLAGGLALRPGIGIICGTGSSVIGVDARGRSWRTGGFGGRMDDVGAGAWVGLEALKAVARAADGRGPKTTLTRLVLRELDLREPRAMLSRIESPTFERKDVAALTRCVTRAAQRGDRVARSIQAHGAAELALCVATIVRRLALGGGPIEVVMTGGVAESDPAYARKIQAAIRRAVPGSRWRVPALAPLGGAALIALRRAGIRIDGDVLDRLRAATS
ncbi:MAG: ATPase [Planctomycetes bacterium]|nr:ATPase [Planctomycetota bacterium]